MAFKYRKRTAESASRRAKQTSGVYDSYVNVEAPWFKPKEGENCIRILPWIAQDDPKLKDQEFADKWGDHWGIDIFIHRNVGPDNGSYLCPNKMSGEPCPICEARNEADEDQAQALKPSNRILAWLIDRNDEKTGPKLWSMPLGTSKDISARSVLKGSGELLNIDDPEEGFDVYFNREGEKDRTRYTQVDVARDPSPLHEDEKIQDRWLKYVEDNLLPDILEFYDADYMEKILFGQAERGERETSKRERPSSRRSGRRGEDEDETERKETTSRGGRRGSRDEEPEPEKEEPDRGRRGRRSVEREEPEGDREESPRGNRRGRGRSDEAEPERDREAESENEGREARSSRGRGSRDDDPKPEAEERGSRTTRYRPGKDDEAPPLEGETDEGEKTTAAARGRLSRLGRLQGRL